MLGVKAGVSIKGSFLGWVCPVCKDRKESGQAFCVRCYKSLPLPMQRKIWRKFGKGYDDAFRESFWYLKTRPDEAQKKLF